MTRARVRPVSLASRLRGVAIAGAVVIVGCMGGFTVWATTAPLSGGAVVRGAIGPDGSRKLVQHLEGGIVREILVRDGDRVQKGQRLLVLEPAQAQAAYAQIRATLSRRRAEAARLGAQLADAEAIDLGGSAPDVADDPEFGAFVRGQQALLTTTRRDMEERLQLLSTQIERLGEQVAGSRGRIAGSTAQRALIDVEIADTRSLFDKGLARKPQMLALERRRSELDTEIEALASDIRRAEIEKTEKAIALRNARTTYDNETSTELAKARSEIAGLESRLTASQDILTRTDVLAPVTGYVLNLQAKSVGGVVRPGTDILEIVPTEGDLVIEGRVAPVDIRNIETGLPARVSFLTFAQRDMPLIPGRVLSVAADAVVDPQTRESYYTARIAVDRTAFGAYANSDDMKPGTPVEAYVEIRARVAMDYFLDPAIHSFRRSFRER
jgi:HlyD family type I secretion membrane fusion protein